MLSLSKPTPKRCAKILELARSAELSYSCQGSVGRGEKPAGFKRDAGSRLLGTGEEAWLAAVESFKRWRFMPASVVEVIPPDTIERGEVAGVLIQAFGVWSLNPARIIEVHDSEDEMSRAFGFTYGTVKGHMEKGEERFLLKWDLQSDEVWYHIDAVSRPNHVLAWLVYPYVRSEQARFRRESCESMATSVQEYLDHGTAAGNSASLESAISVE